MKHDKRQNSGPASQPVHGDDTEPTAAPSHMPIWLFFGLCVLLFWAGVYLNDNAGGFNAQVYPPYQSFAQVKNSQPGGEAELMGREVFARTCSLCHQPHGNGTPGLFPPLAGSEWVTGDPGRLVRIILNGVTGPIMVKGVQWEASMTALGGTLNDKEVAAVATFVRKQWGNSAPEVPEDLVKAIRAEVGDKPDQWTAAELLKFETK
ncbi:MAG TPA: cytochrome c [Methylomirabilota bacterium]|nr:cytochrome c [Methylomirabilota bacterium]